MKTKINVRVQAKGGKFLADDIGGASIVIRDKVTGHLMAKGSTSGADSGQLEPNYHKTCSQRVIVTPERDNTPEVIHWLSAKPGTSHFYTELELDEPAMLEFHVFGPAGGLQTAHAITATQWVVPGKDLAGEPGFVIEIPGLLLQIMEPATHTAITLEGEPVTINLKANVTMMCGCPIIDTKPWIPSDFCVSARIINLDTGSTETVNLDFYKEGDQPSIFIGTYKIKEAGNHKVEISAYQLSTGNTGAGTVIVTANGTGEC